MTESMAAACCTQELARVLGMDYWAFTEASVSDGNNMLVDVGSLVTVLEASLGPVVGAPGGGSSSGGAGEGQRSPGTEDDFVLLDYPWDPLPLKSFGSRT